MGAFQTVKLYGLVEVAYSAPATAALYVYTDQPGGAMALRETLSLGVTTTRQVARLRLLGTTKGKLFRPEIVPSGAFTLYGMRVWARELGAAGQWAWYSVPVVETPDEWTPVKLPIESTPEEWTAVKLPIEPTPENWTPLKLQIEPSSEVAKWVELPMDQ